jgi:hypothetical protein
MRYEDGLAARFKRGDVGFTTLAMAHIGGFADRIPAWLQLAQAKDRDVDAPALRRIFEALLTGDAAMIEAALDDGGYSFNSVSDALILLGRGELLPSLHENLLRQLGPRARSGFTVSAALDLAAADEWDHALLILESARRTGAGIPIDRAFEGLLWKYAYLYRRIDTAMPVLAQMPFSPELAHLVEYRKWQLKAYQIRAGMVGERVPVIDGQLPHGYDEAAAMQVAALADDPAAADYVRNLQRIMKPRTIQVVLADRGIAFSSTNLPQVFSTAEAQIVARQKDYARAAALARRPSQDILVDPPSVVIDAFFDERDWRGAAAIAREHDPRQKRLIAGLDDTRERDYVNLYKHLALAAAQEGDDAAAAAFLADAKVVDRVDQLKNERGTSSEDAFLWFETLLAGVAESRLPRNYLYVLNWAFRSAY